MSFMYIFLFTLDSLPEINEINLIYTMIRFGDTDIIPDAYNTKLYSGHGLNSVKSKHISMHKTSILVLTIKAVKSDHRI